MISAKDSNGVYAAFDENRMDVIVYVFADSFYEGVKKPYSVLRVFYSNKEIQFIGILADNLYDTYFREFQLGCATDNDGFDFEDILENQKNPYSLFDD